MVPNPFRDELRKYRAIIIDDLATHGGVTPWRTTLEEQAHSGLKFGVFLFVLARLSRADPAITLESRQAGDDREHRWKIQHQHENR